MATFRETAAHSVYDIFYLCQLVLSHLVFKGLTEEISLYAGDKSECVYRVTK